MKKYRLLGIVLGTGCLLSIGAFGTYVTSNSTTMGSETELAGMSYTLDQFCSLQAGLGSDPEAIVAFADMLGGGSVEGEPSTTEEMTGDSDVKDTSEYANVGISIAADYVNIRKEPNTDAEIVGKLYRGAAATIVSDDGEWVNIKSGSVNGYIRKDYLAIGYSAEKLIDEFGKKWATVTTETLKVRESDNMSSTVLTLIQEDESYPVTKEETNWAKINVDDDISGYVSKDYIKITVQFKKAISIEEEREEQRRKEAAAAAAAEEDRDTSSSSSSSGSSSSSSSSSSSGSGKSNGSSGSSNGGGSSSDSGSNGGGGSSSGGGSGSGSGGGSKDDGDSDGGGGGTVASGDGAAVVSYALQFVGNPYVYGGSSLTNGTDCSGFTMSVYKHFGVSLPHSSSAQSGYGKKVSWKNAQAGDLIFYGSGGISHVAMAIGDGRVVHASNPSTGIKTSPIDYRTPICARRILG